MFPIFLLRGLVFVLCSLAPPIMTFSHGASHASCRDMIPGHIRAHPLDPQYSYVGLHTSASSYLPGQFITVTVRSSRDFMGFLLQARSVEATKSLVGGHTGMKSTRLGFFLVVGSWIMTPPGTYTLHCFSEGDTVTHSDKQRKRNLSFLWRAPDVPMGDVRFHITVVKSYFVYWAGIESAVVRDGSNGAWRHSNITVLEGANTALVLQEEKTTSFQGLLAHRTSKKPVPRTSPASTLIQWTKTSRTQIPKSLKTFTEASHRAINSTSSAMVSNHATNDTTPASLSGVAKETGFSSVSHTNDLKNYLPFTTSIEQAGVRKTTHFPNITEQISISLSPVNSPVPFLPSSDVETEMKEPTMNSLEQKLSAHLELKDTALITAATSTIHGFHSTNTPPITKQRHHAKLETKTRSGEVRVIHIGPLMHPVHAKIGTHSQTSSSKPPLQPLSDRSEGSISSQSSPQTVVPPSAPTLKSLPTSFATQAKHQSDHNPSGPKSTPKQAKWPQAITPLSIFRKSQSIGSFLQTITQIVPPQDKALIQSTLPFSTFPNFESSSSSSTGSVHSSSVILPSAEMPLHPFRASTLVSMSPPVKSVSLTQSPFSLKSKPKTVPALSAVPSPSPVSSPLQLSSARPSSTSSLPSLFTPPTISTPNTSKYPLKGLFSSAPESTLPPFTSVNSSPCITNSSSSVATAIALSPSSLTTSTLAPSSFSPTSTSSINEAFTSPGLGRSLAPHRSLHTHPMSSVPSQKITSLIKTHVTSSHQGPSLNSSTQRTVVHPNPKPHPNLRLNHGPDSKPKIPSVDTKPSNPAETPNKEGKYPEIIPRNSSWELWMLLGSSAGLGMVLVIGVRYVYRQACGKRTQVTLNDREREYERGDRGLIHVQECGDLVRVRKIRENSFVLLTEYDVLASPGH